MSSGIRQRGSNSDLISWQTDADRLQRSVSDLKEEGEDAKHWADTCAFSDHSNSEGFCTPYSRATVDVIMYM